MSRKLRLSTASLIAAKSTLRVGYRNIRAWFQEGKTINTMKQFRRYRLYILSDMTWTGIGELRTGPVQVSPSHTVVRTKTTREEWSDSHRSIENSSGTRNLFTDRIMSARFDSRYVKLTVLMI